MARSRSSCAGVGTQARRCSRGAGWLDANASAIYHFDVNGQSQLYRAHLVNDMEPGVGLLARALRDAGADERRILEARDLFWESGGNRRTFVCISSRRMPEQRELFSKWAAFRYYTTPAELEGVAIRDMPMPVSELIRREGVSDPRRFFVRDARDTRANPPDCIHNVLMAIPPETESGDLWPLSDIVLKTREKMSSGPAKFKHIAEQGFMDDVESTNGLFVEEVARERRRFPDTIGRRILSAVRSNAPLWMISWLLGRSIPSPSDALLTFGLDEAFHAGGEAARRELNPFTETAQYFGN